MFEFNPAGEIVFELHGFQMPRDVRRLSNGCTLFADATGLYAFDSKGRKIQTLVTGDVTQFHSY